MAHPRNEKSKANAANVELNVAAVLRTLQAVVKTSPIQALAEAANLAVQITTTVQVLCPHIIDNEHLADMYTVFMAMSFIWRAGRTET